MQTIREIMSKNVEVVHPNMNLHEVAHLMKHRDIGAVPVCEGNKLTGIVTDRDIITRVLANNKDPRQLRVSDIMSKEVTFCFEDQNIENAAELMRKKKIRRLAVLDRNRNLSGIISFSDLAPSLKQLAGETLREITSHSKTPMNIQNFRKNWGLLTLGSSIVALSFFVLFRREPSFRERLRTVVPFKRNRVKDLLKAS